jgi:hypothetical protein
MRTYWSAIFSSALRVKRALFGLCRRIARSRTKAGFSSKIPAGPDRVPMSEYLSQLSDVLFAFQGMCDRRRLGIKNEAEGYGLIPLTQGKFAIVDAEDYDWLNQYNWCAGKNKGTFYAHRGSNGKTVLMHREIMRAPKGVVCDHRNHNRLDNRKSNLRLCTPAQNQYNKRPKKGCASRYKGVAWRRDSEKWRAQIGYNHKKIHLGNFDHEIEAAMAYDDKAVELFGEFAYLNFPEKC